MSTRNQTHKNNSPFVHLYDTTLRDGSQRKGLSFSLEDKLKITRLLDAFGVSYIEGGWPGSNPKDMEYFRRVQAMNLQNSKVVAFGATCRVGTRAEDDANLRALIEAATPCVTIVGKSSVFHVERVLETSLEENLRLIADSVRYLKSHGLEVMFDAEHFFDGYRVNPQYSLQCLQTAVDAGADWVVLCDTNGGSLPNYVAEVVRVVVAAGMPNVGVHCHNDAELAVANSLAAVDGGARQVQGTINGYGERCGNTNLVSVVPALQLKQHYECVPAEHMHSLTELSRSVAEIANLNPDPYAPYVGASAFAHKAGLHVAAVEKVSASYEHLEPSVVGNERQVIVSELSGRGNIRMLASELGLRVGGNEQAILRQVKELEEKGYQFENAEGTVELMMRRSKPDYVRPFELVDMSVVVSDRSRSGDTTAEAVVKVRVENVVYHTASEGTGPVHALDLALRKALQPSFPQIADVRLADYKVRILDPDSATNATTRVTIEATSGDDRWCTVGCSTNIIDASYQALADSLELFLVRDFSDGASACTTFTAAGRASEVNSGSVLQALAPSDQEVVA
jgi:2-isopropylmalate synthase